VRGDLFPTVLALRSVSDIILFDQRGTGQTLPSLGTRRTIGAPLHLSSTSPDAKQAMLASSRAAAEEVRARGIDLTAYNTNENADDIDDIRKALDVAKITLWGTVTVRISDLRTFGVTAPPSSARSLAASMDPTTDVDSHRTATCSFIASTAS
jgi:hypothetical protein